MNEPNPFKTSPTWLQYVLALLTVCVVGGLSWVVGKDKPVPEWVSSQVVPGLGWLYLALLGVALLSRVLGQPRG